MSQSESKTDMTDFDVDNYNPEELLAIMGVLDQIKLTKADIIQITQKFIDKYDKNPIFKKFFFDVRKKLLTVKDNLSRESIFYEGVGAKKVDDTIVGERYKAKKTLLDNRKQVIAELKFPIPESKPTLFKQGTTNPTKINTISRIVNFDSHYRTILDPTSVACPNVGPNSNTRLDSATNYTVNLNQPLKQVLE